MADQHHHILIDAGNTRIKLAHFQDGELQSLSVLDSEKELEKKIKDFDLGLPCLISNVGSWMLQGPAAYFKNCFQLDPQFPLPYRLNYQSPDTLGNDRRALAAAAMQTFPNQDCLIFDAGTCLTTDFLSAEQVYYGGAISPGLQMRFKALKDYTAKLPLLEPAQKFPDLIGDSTTHSIQSGICRGFVAEIEAQITQYRRLYPDIKIIVTGGDQSLLLQWLKNDIFAPSNFLLKGLDYLLKRYLIDKIH